MFSIKSLIAGLLATVTLLTCTDISEAHPRRRPHRHLRDGSVIFAPRARPATVVTHRVVGAPVVYRTYTTYNPYYRSNYGYYDRGGYRYYRNRDNRILGRVLLRAIDRATR